MTPMLRREANDTFRRMLTRTVLLPLVVLALLAAIFFFLVSNLLNASSWVEHTDQVISSANQLQTTIVYQQTGIRGFLLTDNQAFLEPYTVALGVVDQQFASLIAMVSDNPQQTERIQSVQTLHMSWQAYASTILAQNQAGENVSDSATLSQGQQLIDQMREILGTFITTEERLRTERVATAQRTTVAVLTASTLAALLLGGVLAYNTRRSLFQLSRTYDTAMGKAEANERELYTQREWFQRTLSSIGDAVIATDADSNISFMNPVAEALTDVSSEQALGKPLKAIFRIVDEQTSDPVEVPVMRALREDTVIGLANNTLLVRPDGTSISIDDSAAPVHDAHGTLVGAVLVFRDISERSASENKLRSSEQRYRDLSETLPVGIFTAMPDGEVDYYNHRWLSYTGTTLDDVLGSGWQPYVHPDDVPVVSKQWYESIGSGQSFELEFRLRRADGMFRWHLVRAEAVYNQHNQAVQWIGSTVDVEDRRLLSKQIEASERRYRDLAEAMPLLVWTANPAGEIDYLNTYWFNYTGLDQNNSLDWNWGPAIHPDDFQATIERWTHSLRTGERFFHEFRLQRANGSFGWHLGQAILQHDDAGTPVKWYGSSVDIDASRQAEQELRESEAAFRQITESMPQLVWTTEPNGDHTYFNQRWYEFTGTTLETVKGDGWSKMLHPDDFERAKTVWAHSLNTGEPYYIEYRFREAATGEYHWFLGRAAAIHDSRGHIAQWFGTCTDIDDQKRVEAELRERSDALVRATKDLEERNRELDQFAYVTSHDLKAPLRGIANLSQWIEEDLAESVTDEARTQFGLLRGRVHRMEALIDGILQYSRIGRVKPVIERVDLNVLLADIVDLLAPQPPAVVQVASGLPTLQTERIHLQQVFQNLINNALKHGQRPDIQVAVACRDRGDWYEFSVRDTGPGIAAQYHEKVFTIFQTLASRDKVEGTGLGLSLVKKMVELHGGQVWLESAEGAGSTFWFTWPK